jgi:hypothetical protein
LATAKYEIRLKQICPPSPRTGGCIGRTEMKAEPSKIGNRVRVCQYRPRRPRSVLARRSAIILPLALAAACLTINTAGANASTLIADTGTGSASTGSGLTCTWGASAYSSPGSLPTDGDVNYGEHVSCNQPVEYAGMDTTFTSSYGLQCDTLSGCPNATSSADCNTTTSCSASAQWVLLNEEDGFTFTSGVGLYIPNSQGPFTSYGGANWTCYQEHAGQQNQLYYLECGVSQTGYVYPDGPPLP